MFLVLPIGRLRPFVRGVYLSLWVPIIGFTHLGLLVPCIWFWGVVHGALFIIFSAVLTSFYLGLALFLIAGIPFANPFKPSMGSIMGVLMFVGLVAAILVGGIQWLVFHSTLLVCGATILFAILACVAVHFGLNEVEKETRDNLKILGFGPQQMFKELE